MRKFIKFVVAIALFPIFTLPVLAQEAVVGSQLQMVLGTQNEVECDAFCQFTLQIASYPMASENVVVTVSQDFPLRSLITIPTLTDAGRTLTIRSADPKVPITLTRGATGNLFTVSNRATLILENIIIDGDSKGNFENAEGTLVTISSGGTFTMRGGAVLCNNANLAATGGVNVATGGTFTMDGGEITGNTTASTSGGVAVAGTFTMNAGKITGNTAGTEGGGVRVTAGTFTMNAGKITGNVAGTDGGGVRVSGSSTVFTMNGGEISDNTASTGKGVYRTGGTVNLNGGVIAGTGTAISNVVSGTYNLNKGEDSPNNAVIFAWNKPASEGLYTYERGTSTNLAVSSDATAVWESNDDKIGILYKNNDSEGFLEIANVSLIECDAFCQFTLQIATYPTDTEDIVVEVAENFTLRSLIAIPTLTEAGRTLTIRSAYPETPAILTRGVVGNLFTIPTRAALILENVIIDGDSDGHFANGGGTLVTINSGGTLVMEDGSVLRNNANLATGGGVSVSGTLIMNAGKIIGNTTGTNGGGMRISGASAIFTMNGGEISGNVVNSNTGEADGGGIIMSGGTFIMEDGKISGNTALDGGGLDVSGSGTVFIMNGGEISGNIATSISGNINSGRGGGLTVWNNAKFTMNGGKINGNTAAVNSGGVYMSGNTIFTMTGGEIIGNTAPASNGIHRAGGTVNITGGVIAGTGTAISNVVSGTYNLNKGEDSPNNAVIFAWNKPASEGPYTYERGTSTNLAVSSGATAVWESNDDKIGILYKNNDSEGFLEIANVSLIECDAFCQFTLQIATYPTDTEDIVVEVAENFTLRSLIAIPTLTETGRTLTIRSVDPETPAILTRGATGNLFTVPNRATLILENVIIDGGARGHFANGGGTLVTINSGGTLVMEDGSVLRNNANLAAGGAVYINSNGIFTMNGGEISDNTSATTSGGVATSGTFTMNYGKISGNVANTEGGGVRVSGGTFAMNGGEIIGNTATTGGGVRRYSSGTINLNGGVVAGTGANLAAIVSGEYNLNKGGGSPNNAVIFAWNKPSGNGPYVYDQDANTNLTISLGATAVWETQDDKIGILYKNSGNEGFVEIANITLITRDYIDITLAKAKIESANFESVSQEVLNTQYEAKEYVEDIIAALELNDVDVIVVDEDFAEANAGMVSNLSGTNGSYTFTVKLSKGDEAEQITKTLTLTILAMPYDNTQDNEDIILAKATIEEEAFLVAQEVLNTQLAAREYVEDIIAALELDGVDAIVVDEDFAKANAGTVSNIDGVNGNYTFSVELNKGAGDEQITETLTLTILATPYDNTQDNTDITLAKAKIESTNFESVSQDLLNTQYEAKEYVEYIIAALELNGVNAVVVDEDFAEANAGTVSDLSGTNGNYTFAVELNKGAGDEQITKTLTLTILATPYDNTQDNTDITLAKAKIESVNIESVSQEVLNTQYEAKEYVEDIIAALELNGVNAVVEDEGFAEANAGTVSDLSGTNGNYTFAVKLSKGDGAEQITKTLTLTILAMPYDNTQDNEDIMLAKATIEEENFSVSQNLLNTQYEAKEYVEYIIAALELNGVNAVVVDEDFAEANAGTVSDLSGTNGNYTFTVKLNKGAGDEQVTETLTLTILATPYDNTQNNTDITLAKATIEEENFSVSQEVLNTQYEAKEYVEYIIAALELNGVDAVVEDSVFTEAIAGTVDNTNGTNGSYTFTVKLNGDAGTELVTKTLTIIATPYYNTQDSIEIAQAKATIEESDFGTVTQEMLNTQAAAKLYVESIIAELELNGVNAVVVNGIFTAAIAETDDDIANGSYKFTVKLNKGVGTEQVTEILTLRILAVPYSTPAIPPQLAKITIQASSANKTIVLQNMPANAKVEIYNLQGKRIYFANSENSKILRIPVQTGVYIVKIGNQTLRVAVR